MGEYPTVNHDSGGKRLQDRWLVTDDGVRIAAQLHLQDTDGRVPDAGLVVAHGFSASMVKPPNRHIVQRFSRRFPVIAFDLRGHGRSDGESSLGGTEIEDVAAAVRWARVLGWRRVVTIGFSMGAAIVVRHAGLVGGVDGVVSVSGPAFWSYRGTPIMRRLHFGVEHPLGRVVVRHGMRTRVQPPPWPQPWPPSPQQAAAGIPPTPFLVVHGREDGFFPDEHPRALVAAADDASRAAGLADYAAQLWMADFGHAEAAIPDALLDDIADWAGRILDPQPVTD
jgi:pimeloyl-ACP methyl ester carboxylesterase